MQGTHLCLAIAAVIVSVSAKCNGTWTELTTIPAIPRQEHTVVAINSTTLAALGGIVATEDGYSNTPLVTYYDIPSDTWIEGPAMPVGLNHPNGAAYNGKIYLLGGLGETDAGPWVAVPETWVLDPSTGVWESLAPFPEGTERGSSVVGIYGDKIYLAGGLRTLHLAPGGASIAVDVVSSYDITNDQWATLPNATLPRAKDHAAGGVVGNTLWVTGGRDVSAGIITTHDTLALNLDDTDAGWTDVTSSAGMPTARGGHSAAVIGSVIYTFGGEGAGSASGVFDQTEAFDTESQTWKSLESMPFPRHGTVGVAISNVVYILGGGSTIGTDPTDTAAAFRP